MIEIMKASAGSGKTFNLARTYIRLLLEGADRYSYRHVLAVTFTNKATDEMKTRIIRQLHILANNPSKSPYFNDFAPLMGGEENLRQRSSQLLSDILHDYGAFSVSTIDRFFQQALKAFSREIGQFFNYQVELDRNSVISESVDRILDALTDDDKETINWLADSMVETMEYGGRYILDAKLKEIAVSLMSKRHEALVKEYGINVEEEYSRKKLAATKKALIKIRRDFENQAHETAKAFVRGNDAAGLTQADHSRKSFAKIYAYAASDRPEAFEPPTDTILNKAEDFASWFRKTDVGRFAHLENDLLPLLQNWCALFGKPYDVYVTAAAILKDIDEMAIAGDLHREYNALLKEKNILALEDSNEILSGIIDGSDAPFVYEKLGVRYDHFLLDEFQDTSRIQWANFKPLIQNSLSQGYDNLIVGDVKQSIYRWRGSDWNMMANEAQRDFTESKVETLDSNYRSLRNIVEFNNGFFLHAASLLDSISADLKDIVISDIYSDTAQKVKTSDEAEGLVEAIFCDPELELQQTLETIGRVVAAGAKLGDIAILCRNNNEINRLATFLIDNGIAVICEDSLSLKSSSLVRQAVSLLSTAGSNKDEICSFIAHETGIDLEGERYSSLFDLCEKIMRILRSRDPEEFDSQTQFIQAFMDYVMDYAQNNGNSIDDFLKAWDENDTKIGSPADPDSVRVMTIHKSKGLQFPHVIVPFAEKVTLSKSGALWMRPDVEGTELEGIASGIYNVYAGDNFSSHSCFSSECQKEKRYQYVDNINVFYVALTRAVKGLTVISSVYRPKSKNPKSSAVGSNNSDFSGILYDYLALNAQSIGFTEENSGDDFVTFSKGRMYDYSTLDRTTQDADIEEIAPGYPSWPLNPEIEKQAAEDSQKPEAVGASPTLPSDSEIGTSAAKGTDGEGIAGAEVGNPKVDVRERGRLKFSADSLDFFKDEVSARVNGTVLHAILSEVSAPGDLPAAVRAAVGRGDLDEDKAAHYEELLAGRIASHAEWFPEDGEGIFNETELIDTDGKAYRPDRVVIRDGKVTIIDYKFGEKSGRYLRQVGHYASIYRRLGYESVDYKVWYVMDDEVDY